MCACVTLKCFGCLQSVFLRETKRSLTEFFSPSLSHSLPRLFCFVVTWHLHVLSVGSKDAHRLIAAILVVFIHAIYTHTHTHIFIHITNTDTKFDLICLLFDLVHSHIHCPVCLSVGRSVDLPFFSATLIDNFYLYATFILAQFMGTVVTMYLFKPVAGQLTICIYVSILTVIIIILVIFVVIFVRFVRFVNVVYFSFCFRRCCGFCFVLLNIS